MSIKINHQEIVRGYEEPVTRINKDICCALCEEVLVRSVQVKEIKEENSYKFICPNCGGKSFINNFEYKVFFEPVNCKIEKIEKDNDIWLVKLLKG